MQPVRLAAISAGDITAVTFLGIALIVLTVAMAVLARTRTQPAPDTGDVKRQRTATQRRLLGVAFTTAITAFTLLFWRGPWWFDGLHIRKTQLEAADGVVITGFRTGLVALTAGLIAAVGLYYTREKHRLEREQFEHAQQQFAESQKQFETTLRETQERDQRQAELTREGQVTGRYVEAIKLLASTELPERLGGIYSLGRIMRDSDRDSWSIAEVLAAFIRLHARKDPTPGWPVEAPPAKIDVQAALLVLGRTPRHGTEVIYHPLDLSHCDLRGYRLAGGDLESMNFDRSNLSRSDLSRTSLQRATLNGATLRGVNMFGANLYRADMTDCDLTDADLRRARMNRTGVANATMDNTKVSGAWMVTTRSLQFDQVDGCVHDATTEFPPDIASWLKTRNEEVARTYEAEATSPIQG